MRRNLRSVVVSVTAATLTSCGAIEAQEATGPATSAPDLTGAMVLESAAGCRFDALTDHALDGLLLLTDWEPFEMRSAPRVFVGGLELSPRVEREDHPGAIPDTTQVFLTSRAPFPEGTQWHGLHPTALHGYYVNNPGSDHYEERGVVFADSPQALHDGLKALGQEVPLPPDNLQLTERGPFSGALCGASIEIRPEGSGALLACGYSC